MATYERLDYGSSDGCQIGGTGGSTGDKIAFYGLSYGGKSAMRTPAVLTDYCLSICSGDFNEWVRKCVSTDMPMSYIHTHEYEIWEWNMGRTFNYAEMAALIAPRPFMVERGHLDRVGERAEHRRDDHHRGHPVPVDRGRDRRDR